MKLVRGQQGTGLGWEVVSLHNSGQRVALFFTEVFVVGPE